VTRPQLRARPELQARVRCRSGLLRFVAGTGSRSLATWLRGECSNARGPGGRPEGSGGWHSERRAVSRGFRVGTSADLQAPPSATTRPGEAGPGQGPPPSVLKDLVGRRG